MHAAAIYGLTDLARFLVEKGADITLKNVSHNANPLELAAAINGKFETAIFFISLEKADMSQQRYNEALDRASKSQHKGMLDALTTRREKLLAKYQRFAFG